MRAAFIASVGAAALIFSGGVSAGEASGAVKAAIDNPARAAANRDRDEARKPAKVLAFTDVGAGETVLDIGAGGGYYTELFSSLVGEDGKVYAHYTEGPNFENQRAALEAQYAPFGNIEITPVPSGGALPVEDGSVDTVILSYIFHHLHYAEQSGEAQPEHGASALARVFSALKPGGEFIVIEHVAAEGSTRAESAGWHRTPPAIAKADITAAGFEFAGEAPEIYVNPEDDMKNVWFDAGLSGKTTSFVHKYRKPQS